MFMHSQASNSNVCACGQQILQTGVYLSGSNVAGWKERSLAVYPGIGNNLIQTLTNTETLCICLLQTKCLSDHQTVSETPFSPTFLKATIMSTWAIVQVFRGENVGRNSTFLSSFFIILHTTTSVCVWTGATLQMPSRRDCLKVHAVIPFVHNIKSFPCLWQQAWVWPFGTGINTSAIRQGRGVFCSLP